MKRMVVGLLAFALVACAVIAVTAIADEEADAADGKREYSKVFKTDAAETLDISTNEASFIVDPRIGSFQSIWQYQDADSTWKDLALSSNFTIGVWTYRLENQGDGLYRLSMSTDETSATTELHLKYRIEFTPVEGAKAATGTMEVVVKISKNGSVLPDHVKEKYTFKAKTSITRTSGKIIAYDADNVEIDGSKYRWFAYELPKGVSVTADGYLAGIPEMTAYLHYVKYYVFVEDPFGNIGKYEIEISIEPRSEDYFAFYVHKGDISTFDAGTAYPYPKVSAVQKGDDAYLVVYRTVFHASQFKITAVGGDSATGYKQVLPYQLIPDPFYLAYKLPTDLTGAYGIVVETTFSKNYFGTTTLYVLPQLDVVVAGIGVSSSSTATDP